jgi:hypothetical protein
LGRAVEIADDHHGLVLAGHLDEQALDTSQPQLQGSCRLTRHGLALAYQADEVRGARMDIIEQKFPCRCEHLCHLNAEIEFR